MHGVNDWIRRTADRDPNIVFCDTRRAAASPGNIDRLGSSPDDLHPSVEGYRRMADAIERALSKALEGRAGETR
jgi:lysophospholipase L1-like esterase